MEISIYGYQQVLFLSLPCNCVTKESLCLAFKYFQLHSIIKDIFVKTCIEKGL